jgi:YVTN family beta-propeller protein
VFNPNGGLAYVTDFTNASVSVINTATSKVTHTILVGGYDLYSTVNAATDEIYTLAITNLAMGLQGADGLTVIRGDKVIKSVAAPSGDVIGLPGVTPNGTYAYIPVIAVNGSTASFVYLMNTKTYQPLTPTITVGNRPEIVVVAHNGKSAYVANGGDSTVSVIQISPAQ